MPGTLRPSQGQPLRIKATWGFGETCRGLHRRAVDIGTGTGTGIAMAFISVPLSPLVDRMRGPPG